MSLAAYHLPLDAHAERFDELRQRCADAFGQAPFVWDSGRLGSRGRRGGHYATETFGVRRLGEQFAERFGVRHEFVDVPNPV